MSGPIVSINRGKTKEQIEALSAVDDGKIFFATDGGIYISQGGAVVKKADVYDEEMESISASLNQLNEEHESINSKIPAAATSENQLADKDWVNSSIASNTATFRGTFETVDNLPTDNVKDNDYAFIIAADDSGNPEYQRYKYSNGAWTFEYTLNNSSFTSDQWKAINSGITSDTLGTLINVITDTYATKTELREIITDAEKVEEATAGILCGIDERLDVITEAITDVSLGDIESSIDDEFNTTLTLTDEQAAAFQNPEVNCYITIGANDTSVILSYKMYLQPTTVYNGKVAMRGTFFTSSFQSIVTAMYAPDAGMESMQVSIISFGKISENDINTICV